MTAQHLHIPANPPLTDVAKAPAARNSWQDVKNSDADVSEKSDLQTMEISFDGKSLEGKMREMEAGILAETRRNILELALRIEQGRITKEIVDETRMSLAKVSEEIEKGKGKDYLFNYPIFDQVGRIVFDDLMLSFGEDAHVKDALRVIMTVFGQRYNTVFVIDADGHAAGIAPTALLINSMPEDELGSIPIIRSGFSLTLDSKPSEARAIMARLGVNVLPVVDKKGFIIGAFTLRDHIKWETALFSSKLKTNIQTHSNIESIQKDFESPAA